MRDQGVTLITGMSQVGETWSPFVAFCLIKNALHSLNSVLFECFLSCLAFTLSLQQTFPSPRQGLPPNPGNDKNVKPLVLSNGSILGFNCLLYDKAEEIPHMLSSPTIC